MFKWIRNKLLEGIVKDVIEELPKLKVSARKLLEEKKDEVLEKIGEAIKEKLLDLVEKL
jgi:hypothetical protein